MMLRNLPHAGDKKTAKATGRKSPLRNLPHARFPAPKLPRSSNAAAPTSRQRKEHGAVSIKLEAWRNIGRELHDMRKAGELVDRGGGRPKNRPEGVTVKTLQDQGISRNKSAAAEKLRTLAARRRAAGAYRGLRFSASARNIDS